MTLSLLQFTLSFWPTATKKWTFSEIFLVFLDFSQLPMFTHYFLSKPYNPKTMLLESTMKTSVEKVTTLKHLVKYTLREIYGVFLVRIFLHLDWIRRDTSFSTYSVRMREDTHQKNSVFGHFSRSDIEKCPRQSELWRIQMYGQYYLLVSPLSTIF